MELSQSKPTELAATTLTSLPKSISYTDLIGKTIIDSSGNIYPSNSALGQTNKPTLGTTSNKFYGLNLKNPEIKEIIIIGELLEKIMFVSKHRVMRELFKKDSRISCKYD